MWKLRNKNKSEITLIFKSLFLNKIFYKNNKNNYFKYFIFVQISIKINFIENSIF